MTVPYSVAYGHVPFFYLLASSIKLLQRNDYNKVLSDYALIGWYFYVLQLYCILLSLLPFLQKPNTPLPVKWLLHGGVSIAHVNVY